MLPAIALTIFGYLSGSIPFGVLLTRWTRGVDVRAGGSGNIGATNVARVAGKKIGLAVLVLDAAKGALPVWLATRLIPDAPMVHAAVGLAAFLGHVFPVWLKLRGGKGVATALGVFAVLLPLSAAAGLVTYAVLLLLFRVSSVGSLAGGLVAVGLAFAGDRPLPYAALASMLFALMLFTHRGNIGRLLRRAERRL
ncbi:MAG: glycerol-3-phosphate 1-O-acyltransferase PlsY [Myxococcaceae bacterium]